MEYVTRLLTDKVRLLYVIEGKHALGLHGFKKIEEYDAVNSLVGGICIGSVTPGASHWCPHPESSITKAYMPLDSKCGLNITYGMNHKQFKVWLEFNPDKLSDAGFDNLRTRLKQVFHFGGASFLAHAKVSMCEVSIDIDHAHFDGYDFFDVRKTSEDPTYLPLGTQYIGNKNGASHWKMYDKGNELQQKQKIFMGHERLRIEKTLNVYGKVSVANWGSMPNPFNNLRVIDKAKLNEGEAKLFLSMLSYKMNKYGWTAQQTFHDLPKAEQKIVLNAVHLATPSWWKPQQIWTEFPSALAWLKKLV